MVPLPKVLKSEVFLHGQKHIFKRNEVGSCERQNEWPTDNERNYGETWNQK